MASVITLTDADLKNLPGWEVFGTSPPRDNPISRFYHISAATIEWPRFAFPEEWNCHGILLHRGQRFAHFRPQLPEIDYLPLLATETPNGFREMLPEINHPRQWGPTPAFP